MLGKKIHASAEVRLTVLPGRGLFVVVSRSSQRPLIVTVVLVSATKICTRLVMVNVWADSASGKVSSAATSQK